MEIVTQGNLHLDSTSHLTTNGQTTPSGSFMIRWHLHRLVKTARCYELSYGVIMISWQIMSPRMPSPFPEITSCDIVPSDMPSKATALFRSLDDRSWTEKNLIGLDTDHIQYLRQTFEDTRKNTN